MITSSFLGVVGLLNATSGITPSHTLITLFFYFTSITTLGMNYGYKSRSKSAASAYRRRGGNYGGYSKKFGAFKKAGRKSAKQPFVTKRLSRREIKYDDDYFNLNKWESFSAPVTGLNGGYMNWVLGGVISTTKTIATQMKDGMGGNMVTVHANDVTMMPNCLTNVDTGTTAKTRIGNLITPRYLTIKGVLSAAKTLNPKDEETTFKDEPGSDPMLFLLRFVRTSIKVFIVRDKSMNEKGYVTYNDVFELPFNAGSALNPFLWHRKVDSIGRYEILKEYELELDQDDPQASFSYTIPLMGKPIRFNGAASTWQYDAGRTVGADNIDALPFANGVSPSVATVRTLKKSSEAQSMTNGIYILAVAHTAAAGTVESSHYDSPTMIFSSRLTFEDN